MPKGKGPPPPPIEEGEGPSVPPAAKVVAPRTIKCVRKVRMSEVIVVRPSSINIQYDQILQTEQRAGTIYHVMLGSTLAFLRLLIIK